MDIKTFVFLDSETTGLPAFEHNTTKITELCLISIQVEHIRLGISPRVQNKLNLCFNPLKRIHPEAENLTGLYNDELSSQSSFNSNSLNLINSFLSRLSKPICFVAHNGNFFDYPILRTHIESVKAEIDFLDNIYCVDSLLAFREILNNASSSEKLTIADKITNVISDTSNLEVLMDDAWDDILFEKVENIENSLSEASLKEQKTSQQILNETTPSAKQPLNLLAAPKKPKRNIKIRNTHDPSSSSDAPAARRRLNFTDENIPAPIPKRSFKLSSVYERVTQKPPKNAHQAEADVCMMMECAVHLNEDFVNYANTHAILFSQIPKMEPGKKVGL